MKVGTMGNYRVNEKPEANFPARVTWCNGDGTADLCVMIHKEDYPEFSQAECEQGHAHRLGIKIGTGNGEFQADEAPASVADTRVDSLVSQVSSLSSTVAQLADKVSKLSAPQA